VKDKKYWEIMPGKKSEQKVREKVRIYLDSHGHSPAKAIADGLNVIIRGWLLALYSTLPGKSTVE